MPYKIIKLYYKFIYSLASNDAFIYNLMGSLKKIHIELFNPPPKIEKEKKGGKNRNLCSLTSHKAENGRFELVTSVL